MINEVPFGSDGDFSPSRVTDCINAKLSNDLGNLAYRTLSFAYKHCDKATPTPTDLNADDEEMLRAARDMLPSLRALADGCMLHKMTKELNVVVQQANRYIDTQAPWALKKTDEARMQTVLWVLMETLRIVGILQAPVTPTISTLLLDQIACPPKERTFAHLSPDYALQAGTPLPTPAIIVPRYEPPEEEEAPPAGGATAAAAEVAPPELSGDELLALEAQIKEQGDRVRDAKAGGDSDRADAEVAALLALKAQLPSGHELLGGGKKKKKKSKSAAA